MDTAMSHTLTQCRIRYHNVAYAFDTALRVCGISALLPKFINTNIVSTGHRFSILEIWKAERSILKIKPKFHLPGMRHCGLRFVCFHINEYPCVFRIQPSDSHESLHWAIRLIAYAVAHVESCSYIYTCYISCRICIMHAVYTESRL